MLVWSKRSRSSFRARRLGDLTSGGVVLCFRHQILRLSYLPLHGNPRFLNIVCVGLPEISLAKRLFKVCSREIDCKIMSIFDCQNSRNVDFGSAIER